MAYGSIFQVQNGEFSVLPARSMREGLYGEKLEAALQRVLQEHPEIIPGEQMEPGSDDPPRFLLLKRELSIGSWSLDHLFVDHLGVPTLVECKLIQNPQSRREVIGQVIEYAANIQLALGNGALRQIAERSWTENGADLADTLVLKLDVEDVDDFWLQVEQNLEAGKIRLVVAGDEIRPEVRRMIEYLNSEMHRVDVFGLEIKCYGINGENMVMVSNVIGGSQRETDKKHIQATKGVSTLWTAEALKEHWLQNELPENQLMNNRYLDWVIKNNRFQPNRSIGPVLNLCDGAGRAFFAVYTGAEAWSKLKAFSYEERVQVQTRLVEAGFIRSVDDKKIYQKIDNLDLGSIERFLDIVSASGVVGDGLR